MKTRAQRDFFFFFFPFWGREKKNKQQNKTPWGALYKQKYLPGGCLGPTFKPPPPFGLFFQNAKFGGGGGNKKKGKRGGVAFRAQNQTVFSTPGQIMFFSDEKAGGGGVVSNVPVGNFLIFLTIFFCFPAPTGAPPPKSVKKGRSGAPLGGNCFSSSLLFSPSFPFFPVCLVFVFWRGAVGLGGVVGGTTGGGGFKRGGKRGGGVFPKCP